MVLLVLFSNFFGVFSVLWVAIWWSFFWGKFVLLSWQLPRSAAHQWCHHLLAINPCNYPRSETSKWVFQMGVSFFFQLLLGWVGGLGLELGWGWGIVTIVEISTSCVFFLEWTLIHLHVMGQAMILWCVLCCCIFLLNNCILQARQKDWNIFARRPPLQRKPTKRQTRNVRNRVAKYPVIMLKIQVSQMFFTGGTQFWVQDHTMPLGATLLAAGKKFWVFRGWSFFGDQLGDQNKEVEIDLQVVSSQHQGFCQQPCYSPHGQDASCSGSRVNLSWLLTG